NLPSGQTAGSPLWFISITVSGFQPRVFPLPADATTCGSAGNITLSTNSKFGRICLISLGTVILQPLSAPLGRATLAGSIFGSNGRPLDGASLVLIDSSGHSHTRVSGTDCDGHPIGGVATGFYCVQDSTGDTAGSFVNDALGLPTGSAKLAVVNNTLVNCSPAIGPPGAPGTTCGVVPAFASLSLSGGVVNGQDLSLGNKTTPASVLTSATSANAFGYVL